MSTNLATANDAISSDTVTTPMAYVPKASPAASDAVNDGRFGRGLRTLRGATVRVMNSIRSLGPYVAIELLLPGGTIIALALWAYRKRIAARARGKATTTDAAPAARAPRCFATPCTQH